MSSAPPRPGCAGSTTASSASLTGGLPSLTTNLERGNDGIVHFTNLQLYSPKLRLSGAGERFKDGTFHIVAAGRQAKYGPLKLVLDGHIERPEARPLPRPSPNDTLGITRRCTCCSIRSPAGFNYRASGGSQLGPFTSNGQILLPHERADGDRHRRARRRRRACQRRPARPIPGGFTGRLTLANGTLGGTLDFSPAGQAQRIDAHLTADQRELPRRLLGPQRPRRRHHHPRRRPDHDRRQRRRARHRSGRGRRSRG